MIQFKRDSEIIHYLEAEHAASIKALAKHLFVSEATVRRDLREMERQGLIRRVFGGVILEKYTNENIPHQLRKRENVRFKEAVAAKAAPYLFDDAVIMMDSSTTTKTVLPYLSGLKNLTVITNNMEILNLIDASHIRVFCTGGQYNMNNQDFLGHHAEQAIRSLHADLCLFSAQGFSSDGYITDPSESECAIRKAMIAQSDKRIFLCDHTKLGKQYTYRICGRDDVDVILCDTDLPEPSGESARPARG